MKTLGIDIGTTTISAAVLEDGQFLASETRANGAFIPSALTCAREQDVEKITQTALSVIETLFERYPCCFANKLRKIFIQSAKKKRRLKGF